MKKKGSKWDTLDGVLNEVWTMLKRGVSWSNDPFHWPVLGTTGDNGCSMRTVILRQFLMPERILMCYTDGRSEKVKEIDSFPQTGWLFYHPKRKVQLRITGPSTLHREDQFANDQWSSTPLTHRFNYSTKEPPGTSIGHPSSGLPEFISDAVQKIFHKEIGREHFVVISSRIDTIDWLRLSPSGNRRARFDWNDRGMTSTWLVP